MLEIDSVSLSVLHLYWLVWFSVCCWPLVSLNERVSFWYKLIFKLMLPLITRNWFVQHLFIFLKSMFAFVVIRIIKWRIHVFWFIQTLMLYNMVILVAENMPNFGVHLMLINKCLRYKSDLLFDIFNRCTLILHFLYNIRDFIDLILHKKLRDSSSCGHCSELMIINAFIDNRIALPGGLTVFNLFYSRDYVLAKV